MLFTGTSRNADEHPRTSTSRSEKMSKRTPSPPSSFELALRRTSALSLHVEAVSPPRSGLRQVIEPGARSSGAGQARFAIDRRKAYIWIHAHSGFSGSVDRNALGNGTGASSGLRSKFPGLPANLRPRWRQYRLQLYIAASVQCVGFGPRGAMPDQSIFRTSNKKASRRGALSLTF